MNRLKVRSILLAAVSIGAMLPVTAMAQTSVAGSATANQDAPSPPQEAVPPEAGAEAPAQDAAGAQGDIVVTGTRAALENAERVKRDSIVVVDGISADDISALPDASISDSLVRVTGVTANDGPRGPDAISIRGLGPDLSITTVNGRLLATPNGGDRRVSLAQLPTEGISGAYVQKTPDASTIEGGVAGTLDLRTIYPLETRRRGLTLVGRAVTQDNASALGEARRYQPWGGRAEATYVGQFAPNLGLALTYAYLRQYTGFVGQQNDNYRLGTTVRGDLNANGALDALPTNVGVTSNFNDVSRHSVIGMVQWEPVSEVRVSLDGLYVRDRLFNGPTRFFANNIFNGVLGAPTSATVDEFDVVQAFSGQVALYRGLFNESRQVDQNYGVGLKIAVDKDPFTAIFDVSFNEAKRDSFAPQATIETDGNTAIQQRRDFSYDFTDRDNAIVNFTPTIADDFALSQFQEIDLRIRDTIKAARADFAYDPATDFIKSIGFGFKVDRRERSQARDATVYSFGTTPANALPLRPDLDASYLQTPNNPFAERASYFGGTGAVAFPYFDVQKLSALKNAPGVVVADQFGGDVAGTFDVTEDTAAVYAQLNLQAGPLSGNAGLRYVVTDTGVEGSSGTSLANVQDLSFDNTYKYLLPSVNVRYEITPTLLGRIAYSETFSRQQFSDLSIGAAVDLTTVPAGALIINRGNPDLKPFTSRGFDVGLEWFPSRSTNIAVAGYVKKLKNFLVASAEQTTTLFPDGTSVPTTIQTTINDPQTRDLRGVELSVRQQFDFLPGVLRNLGFLVNLNYNDTDVIQQTTSIIGRQPNPATGDLGDLAAPTTVNASADLFSKFVANGQLYYSSRVFDLRIAYRYFDPYVRAFFNSSQEQPDGQLDISGGVNLFRKVRLIGSVTNVTKSKIRRYVPDYRNPDNRGITQLNVYQGRQATVGVRMNF